MIQALRLAVRRLFRAPLYTVSVCGVLALAGAALTASGVVAYGVLFAPLPYAEPDEIVFVERQSLRTGSPENFTPADFLDVRERAESLAGVAAVEAWSPVASGDGAAERLKGVRVTGDLFQVLGRQASLGRVLEPADDRPEAAPTVVVSHRLWQRLFGGEASAVSREIRLNGENHVVLGVMPADFEFPTFWQSGVDLWAPARWAPERSASRSGASLRVFARLAEGATVEQAQAEARTISESLRAQFPETHANRGVGVWGVQERTVKEIRPTLWALAGGAGLLWLIAIVNLTALAVVRAGGRRTESAVRRALGETRARSLGQEAAESGLLALFGSALGAALGLASLYAVAAGAPASLAFLFRRWQETPVGLWAVVATTVPAIGAASALALAGVLSGGDARLVDRLRARSDAFASRRSTLLRNSLTGGEVALAVLLTAVAGLVGRSLVQLASVDPGFEPDHVTTAVVPVAGSTFGDADRKAGFYRTVVERLEAAPGVESVALVNHAPLVGDIWGRGFHVEGTDAPQPGSEPSAAYRVASPGYFRTIGARLTSGRDFNASDDAEAPPVVIVNQSFVDRHLPQGSTPTSLRIRLGGPESPWRPIVGVVADLRQYEWTEVGPAIFTPWAQEPSFRDDPANHFAMTIVARSSTPTAARELRRIVADLDSTIPVDRVTTLAQAVDGALWQPRLTALLMGAFALIALALAGFGVYGTAAQAVARRRAEFGVRIALGATRKDVLAMAVGQNFKLVTAGIAVGAGLAFAFSGLVADLLYEVDARDVVALFGACLALALTGLLAGYLPARRAASVDPAIALRQD